jgi:DNA-binding transcriptional ArsR family regulator
MAVRARKIHVIQTVEELKALRSPIRLRILSLLQKLGEASVSILADRIGLKAESLYYHIHILEKRGLIEISRQRETGRRPETFYAPVAPHYRIDERNKDPKFLQSLIDLYRTQLRHAENGIAEALLSEADSPGPRSKTLVQQYEVSLRPFKAERLKRLLGTLNDFLADADDPKGNEHYTLTLVMSQND